MKLRLAAHAVRLRILRSELAALEAGQSLEQRVRFAPGPSSSISYSLSVAEVQEEDGVRVTCECGDLRVVLSPGIFVRWCTPEEVGIYIPVNVGEGEPLNLIIEKDFACLDRDDADNRDTFEHPHLDAVC